MLPIRSLTRPKDFWRHLDAFQESEEWDESEQEADSFDREVCNEIQWKEMGAQVHGHLSLPEVEQHSGRQMKDIEQLTMTQGGADHELNPRPDLSASPAGIFPSFHPSHVVETSTPRVHSEATYPEVPTPSTVATPVLPHPLRRASTMTVISHRKTVQDTPDHIPSPIDTPDSSRPNPSVGEGRGRRDDPATPVPLGSAAFSTLKAKKDYQTLTKHFEAFAKTVAKQDAAPPKSKATGRTTRKAPTVAGLGGKVFGALRFCIPPELGQVTKHKQRWDIISKLGGQVTLQPDTAITHVIYDAGRSASVLARELGLQTLSELPRGTVCVRWDWVVQCKMAGEILDTSSWLTFPKNAFSRAISYNTLRAPSRMADITDLLTGRGLSISRKREPTASDSDTESPKRPRMNTLTRSTPAMLSHSSKAGPSRLRPTIATRHALPTGPGWQDGLEGERDGLDEMISGLKNGSIRDVDENMAGESPEEEAPSFQADGMCPAATLGIPDPQADSFQCGRDHDGRPADGPNEWLAMKFDEMHDLYQGVQGKSFFAIRQYQQAASAMRRTSFPITSGAQALKVKGVGQGMADRIDEFLTGAPGRHHYEHTEQMRAVQVFKDIYGVGKVFANELYRRGARTIEDLRTNDYGLTAGQLIGVELYEDLKTRIPREECRQIFDVVRDEAHRIDPKVWIEIMGSYRRGQETSGDVDFLITRDTADGSTHAGMLSKLVGALRERGVITHDLSTPHDYKALEAKWMGVGKIAATGKFRRIDILCIPFDQWGGALIYFTGNDIFNRSLRLYARKKGYRLNQRGLYKDMILGRDGKKLTEGEIIASRTEEEIFNVLGVRWRHPHLRRP